MKPKLEKSNLRGMETLFKKPQQRTQGRFFIGLSLLCIIYVVFVLTQSGQSTPPLLTSDDQLMFEESFEKNQLSLYFQSQADQGHQAGKWVIKEGRLFGEKIHNAALWISPLVLPENVRIEFDARAESTEGDVKCEIFGDGKHHQSGYILVAGGWKNSMNIIARQDEHGEDRKADTRCRGSKRHPCVRPKQIQSWVIERRNHVISWWIDQELVLKYVDQHPIQKTGFAFNNWSAPVSFDNLKVYKLNL